MAERVALVTGGARGIGRAIAAQLAEHGRIVAVGDLQEAEDVGALAVQLDVTDSASGAAAGERGGWDLGPIKTLVNTAGWDGPRPFLETDEPFWDRVIEIN